MSVAFTPGPWQRSGVRVKLGEHDCFAVGPDGFSIAFLPIGNRPFEQAGAIADAKLIAAAPELYRKLESAPALPTTFDQYQRFKSYYEDFRRERDELLAKVRGEQ